MLNNFTGEWTDSSAWQNAFYFISDHDPSAFCNITTTTWVAVVPTYVNSPSRLLFTSSTTIMRQTIVVTKWGTMQFSLEGVYFSTTRVFPIRKSYLNKQPASETFTHIQPALRSDKW